MPEQKSQPEKNHFLQALGYNFNRSFNRMYHLVIAIRIGGKYHLII